jgi:hypothetical protein
MTFDGCPKQSLPLSIRRPSAGMAFAALNIAADC